MGMGFVSHHLIRFSREAILGEQNASFYSTRDRREDDQLMNVEARERVA